MSNFTNLIAAISNKTMLEILMGVLIVFVLLLAVLGIVFVIALRKRAPVIKVVMAPSATDDDDEQEDEHVSVAEVDDKSGTVEESKEEYVQEVIEEVMAATEEVQQEVKTESKPAAKPDPEEDENDDDDGPSYVIEGQERVRYDRSLTAKICQLKGETKEWYSDIKNEILSYERVKDRMSWRRESFRIGRMTFARLTIRGKTLCLMLAVEPGGYAGTKYAVEDVSNVNSTADTPTLYRIKSERRLKYAKEMIAGIMKELKCYKNSHYEPKDFFTPYEGDMALMQKGLVKRIVIGSTRTFKIEEVTDAELENAINESEQTATLAQQSDNNEEVK
ncbi:MAG: hypothetical protein K2M64_02335 [Clostridia bacterium]|nr:hypothetical protein [Clostridia bacterium]